MIFFKDGCQANILFLISFIGSVAAEKNVPVLFWETRSSNSSKVLPPGLAKMSTSDFLRIFNEKLLPYRKPPLVLVFAEDKLSVEDFGWRDESGQSLFPQLRALTNQSGKTTFFPSVSEPITGLKHALSQNGFTVQNINLNVTRSQKQDLNLNMESVQSIDLAKNTRNTDKSTKSSRNSDLNANSFPNQNLNIESVQGLNKNAEWAKIKDAESIPNSDRVDMFTEKSDDEIATPKALMFRLSAASPGESRPSVIRRHDGEIAQAFAARMSAQAAVIVIYTAHAAAFRSADTKHRERRQSPTDPQPPPQEPPPPLATSGPQVWGDDTSTILLYFHKSPPLYEISEAKVKDVVIAKSISSDKTAKYLRLLVKGSVGGSEVNLGLCFSLTTSYWELAKVEVMVTDVKSVDLLPTAGEVVVARGYSYTCRGDVVFTDGEIRFTLANFQMQAFMSSPKFSNAQDCVTYFSIGIWSGVVVMFVMTVVLAWAITMIMNIKVNDKHDDRYGKTIHVGAGN